jgi:hypothetical protein
MQDQTTDQARKIGSEHGKAAASWVFDGNTTDENYRATLAGIENGDPQVMDAYRTPDLSGEYSGDYTDQDLAADLGLDQDSDSLDDAATAYLDATSEAFWSEVERIAREHVSQTLCANCGRTEEQAGCTIRTRVIDWRTDYLCAKCVASYDWSDWDYDGVATYRHKTPEPVTQPKPVKLSTRGGWWTFTPAIRDRVPFTTSGALRGGSPEGSTGRLPADWRNLYQTGADYVIYSYATPIAWHRPADDLWIIPDEKYSVTTSRHQSIVATVIGQLS